MERFLKWLILKAETTKLGRILTITLALVIIIFFAVGIGRDPSILKDITLMFALGFAGLLILSLFGLVYLFFVKKKG